MTIQHKPWWAFDRQLLNLFPVGTLLESTRYSSRAPVDSLPLIL